MVKSALIGLGLVVRFAQAKRAKHNSLCNVYAALNYTLAEERHFEFKLLILFDIKRLKGYSKQPARSCF
jgi:hypothetical protein